jgi:hypothetical protein
MHQLALRVMDQGLARQTQELAPPRVAEVPAQRQRRQQSAQRQPLQEIHWRPIPADVRAEERGLPPRGLARRPMTAEEPQAIVAEGIAVDSLAQKALSRQRGRGLAGHPIAMEESSRHRPIVAGVATFAEAQYSARFPIAAAEALHLMEGLRLALRPIVAEPRYSAHFPIAAAEALHLMQDPRLALRPIVAEPQYSAHFPIAAAEALHLMADPRLALRPIVAEPQYSAHFPIAAAEALHLMEDPHLALRPIAVAAAPGRSIPTSPDCCDTAERHNSAYHQQAAIPA